MDDLVILSPDSAYKEVFPVMLARYRALGIRPINFRVVPDPLHDSSDQAVELLRPFQGSHQRALMVRDLEGSGREEEGVNKLQARLQIQLIQSGWAENSAAVLVLDPELESWLRFGSSHMGHVIKERARRNKDKVSLWESELDAAIVKHGGGDVYGKPVRPKEVFHDLLRHFGIPPSNAVLGKLAEKESLANCVIPSFNRFCELMQKWFPVI